MGRLYHVRAAYLQNNQFTAGTAAKLLAWSGYADFAPALGDPDVEQLPVGVRIVSPRVDHDGKVELAGEGDLLGEDFTLDLTGGVHVVVVEAALADRHYLGVLELAADLRAPAIVELGGLVGVDPDRGEDARVAGCQIDRSGVPRDSIARSDRDQRVDAGLTSALDHLAPIPGELVRRDVAVTVEPHDSH